MGTGMSGDDLSRRIATIDAPDIPITSTGTSEYDAVGNVLASTDSFGHRTEYIYDNRNQQTAVTDVLFGRVVMRYDDMGNVVEVTDPVQNTTAFVCDGRNRLKSEINKFGKTRSV
jgi:YD repeat-containing protein